MQCSSEELHKHFVHLTLLANMEPDYIRFSLLLAH